MKIPLIVLFGLVFLASAAQYVTFHTIQGRAGAPTGWKVNGVPHPDHEIQFSIHLKQCNLDALSKKLYAVSDPDSAEYGHYLSAKEANEIVSCGNNAELDVIEWLQHYQITKFKVVSNAIQVTASVAVVEKLLQTTFEEYSHEKKGFTTVRQTGTVSVPSEIKDLVDFITGISEFFHGSKFEPKKVASKLEKIKKIQSRLAEIADDEGYDPNSFLNITDPLITVTRLRKLYNVPAGQMVTSNNNALGIAAFSNAFDEQALCNFQVWNNLGGVNWDWEGPRTGDDQVESDLDIQYASGMADGIFTVFNNHPDGSWVLDWAQDTVANTEDSGPWVWSVSYGWPEVAQCITVFNFSVTNCPAGYDFQKYIQATDAEFQKLGTMGVTVVISSGDDGSPGFSWNCPIDSSNPVNGDSCNQFFTDCECAELIITATVGNETYTCMFPFLGIQNDCYEIFNNQVEDGLCTDLLTNHLNGTAAGNWASDEECWYAFGSGPSFWSNCTCEQLEPITVNNGNSACSVQGYQYNASNGDSFFPDYPASSPFVTSVGATALQYNLDFCYDTINKEEIYAMGNDMAGYGGGGGFSSVNPMPAYQSAVVSKYLKANSKSLPPKETYNPGNRAYPDVAMNGHNFMVHIGFLGIYEGVEPELGYQGAIQAIGGTSASAPTFAGLIALINDIQLSKGRPTLGFLNPMLYKFADTHPHVFNDITPELQHLGIFPILEGTNTRCTSSYCCEYGFPVATGWDAGTGLGTIDFGELVKAIDTIYAAKESNKVVIN